MLCKLTGMFRSLLRYQLYSYQSRGLRTILCRLGIEELQNQYIILTPITQTPLTSVWVGVGVFCQLGLCLL